MNIFQQQAAQDMDVALAQLPVLDLGPYLAGENGALDTLAEKIADACARIGFFYITNHGVPEDLIEQTFAQSKRFHALPLEVKNRHPLDAANIGYMAMNTSMQAHSTVHKATTPNQNESFFITHDRADDHPDVVKGTPLRGQNYWPDDLPDFREGVMAYFGAVNTLGHSLVPPFARALGMAADYLDEDFAEENNATLRMLHYPPTETTDKDIGNDFGTAPHTDNSFMTILARMEVPGLAIRLPSGEWLAPPLIPGTFLVNIGNMARRMSNDKFLSTPHGVIVDGATDRYSLAYFHSPNPYRMIRVAASCMDEGKQPKYEPRLYADLMKEFYSANYFHQKDHKTVEMKNQYD